MYNKSHLSNNPTTKTRIYTSTITFDKLIDTRITILYARHAFRLQRLISYARKKKLNGQIIKINKLKSTEDTTSRRVFSQIQLR